MHLVNSVTSAYRIPSKSAQRQIPALLDWHIQVLRDEAIDDRDRQAALLGPLQMKCDKQLEQLQQAIAEQRTEFEQRIESLSNELTASRTAATEQKSELKSLAREKTNLQTINAGLSARVDKALASLSTVQAQVSGQTVLLDAEKEKVAALQVAMTTRLDDKDQLNASLKKQVVPQSVVAMKKTKRKMR
jgi:chromosome segregation ATPase